MDDNQSDAQSEVTEISSVQSAAVAANDRNSVASSPVELETSTQSRGSPAEIDGIPTQAPCMSEDSNQSEVSQQSLDLDHGDDLCRRMVPIPEHIKLQSQLSTPEAIEIETIQVDSVMESDANKSESENKKVGLRNTQYADADSTCQPQVIMKESDTNDDLSSNCGAKRMPSIEDFYMKDTKTLNTNVLVTEFIQEPVSTDSEKFHKPDNVNRPSDPYETLTLSDFLLNEVKDPPVKPIKETNLLANLKDKFAEDSYSKKCMFADMMKDAEEGEEEESTKYSINNIKRMKIDEEEKNIRMQARLKVKHYTTCNTKVNITPHVILW